MKRIVVSGATGFIGRRLVEALVARGDEVTVLSRDPGTARATFAEPVRIEWWNPNPRIEAPAPNIEADAVVHLAGEQAVGRRWTAGAKKQITDSRVQSTDLVVTAMGRAAARRPAVFVCASAVGYYGARGDDVVDERAPAGTDFLAQVTVAWEKSAMHAEALGIRVVRARFGIVLGRGGGALTEMAMPFRMFVGGPIGSGRQYVSWVHRDDVVSALTFCLDREDIQGAVNVTSPHPVTNDELSKVIGRVLHRPSSLRVPEFALRLRFGEGADPILTGQRVEPGVLSNHGFSWRYPRVEEAVAEALG
jgi:uncharacterized protein (TIGR01777 family)